MHSKKMSQYNVGQKYNAIFPPVTVYFKYDFVHKLKEAMSVWASMPIVSEVVVFIAHNHKVSKVNVQLVERLLYRHTDSETHTQNRALYLNL